MTEAATHRPFGKTGLQVPRVVFGATCLGNLFVAMSDRDKRELVRQWFQQMPKPVAIDSAGKYGAGLSLEVIGRELAALAIDPADVVISNKLAWRRVPLKTPQPTFEPGVWIDIQHDAVQDISHDGILRCHQDGLAMLAGYTPDLVSLHDPDEYLAAAGDAGGERNRRMDDLCGAHQALCELRDDGQVAGVGVGAKNWRIIRELDRHCDFDWVMLANSFTIMNHPPELIEFIDSLASRNIAVINSALTHGGFLAGGSFIDYRPIDAGDPEDAKKIAWRDRFHQVCQQHDQSAYRVAVAFGASHPGITSVALSTSSPARVQSMVQAASDTLPAELWSEMREQQLIWQDYPHL
jgi:D-threo-aldose 1-dehydrogenase